MKVISVKPDGSALVEFENLHQHTSVIGVVEPIRAIIAIDDIPELVRNGQKAHRASQKFSSFMGRAKKVSE
ncbi:MAG: hypothetical protein HZB12_02465 [Candidatus Yonathbacteria bacterium]|nr:hypothetical protein [Candidatus Yonathbacteria bacterium]